jgi:hypothetical protein
MVEGLVAVQMAVLWVVVSREAAEKAQVGWDTVVAVALEVVVMVAVAVVTGAV